MIEDLKISSSTSTNISLAIIFTFSAISKISEQKIQSCWIQFKLHAEKKNLLNVSVYLFWIYFYGFEKHNIFLFCNRESLKIVQWLALSV